MGAVRWAPGGQAFAVVVESGTVFDGRVEVYSADGARDLATIPGGWDVGWLDATSLAVLLERPDGSNGQVVVHHLDGRPDTQLPGRTGGILASARGRVAVTDPYAFNGQDPSVFRILTASDSAPTGWIESDPIDAGWPRLWSEDGKLLVVQIPASGASANLVASSSMAEQLVNASPRGLRFAAGGAPPVHVAILRFPGADRVSVPDLLLDPQSVWALSPDDRWFAAADPATGDAVVMNLETAKVTRLRGYWVEGWTPTSELVLGTGDWTSALWHTDGTVTPTGLPAGTPIFGPLPGDVAINMHPDPNGNMVPGTFEVRMAGFVADVPVLVSSAGWATWSPDGLVCLVSTPSDDAQAVRAALLRVARP